MHTKSDGRYINMESGSGGVVDCIQLESCRMNDDDVSREMGKGGNDTDSLTQRRGGESSRMMCVLFGFRAVRMLEKFKSRR